MASLDWTSAIVQYLKLGADATATRGTLIESIASGVQSSIEKYIGRTLDVQTHTEYYNGNDKPTLYLRWAPVVSVVSVSLNSAPLTVGDPAAPTFPHLIYGGIL